MSHRSASTKHVLSCILLALLAVPAILHAQPESPAPAPGMAPVPGTDAGAASGAAPEAAVVDETKVDHVRGFEKYPPLTDRDLAAADVIVIGRLNREALVAGPEGSVVAELIVHESIKGAETGQRLSVRIQLPVFLGGKAVAPPPEGAMGAPARTGPTEVVIGCLRADSSHWRKYDATQLLLWLLPRREGTLVMDRPARIQSVDTRDYFAALSDPAGPQKFMDLLKAPNAVLRLRVLDELLRSARPEDLPAVLPLIDDPSDRIALRAVQVVSVRGDATLIPAFRQLLSKPGPLVRIEAIAFLSRFDDRASIPAMGQALTGMDADQTLRALAWMGRMSDKAIVPALLPLLDRDPAYDQPQLVSVDQTVAGQARAAIFNAIGMDLPLDSAAAAAMWKPWQSLPEDLMLRKTVENAIEALGRHDFLHRAAAYRFLVRQTNVLAGDATLFGMPGMGADHNEVLSDFREWATENLLATRAQWLQDSFVRRGVLLPWPMTSEGLGTLVAALDFYANLAYQTPRLLEERGAWIVAGGEAQGRQFTAAANDLLQLYTGQQPGLLLDAPEAPKASAAKPDAQPHPLAAYWVRWWQAHRDNFEPRELPAQPPVTAEQLAAAPPVAEVVPLKFTVALKSPSVKAGSKAFVQATLANVSDKPVTIASRPRSFACLGTSVGGGLFDAGYGKRPAEFITIAPGKSHTFDLVAPTDPPEAQDDLDANTHRVQFRLDYPFNVVAPGQRAWRGILWSPPLTYTVEP